jgi:hypothetical protein
MYHWYAITSSHDFTSTLSSGIGKSFFVLYSSNASLIDFNCAILLVSLVQARYQEKDTKPIVASIANIVITTISSTSVKATLFPFFIKKWVNC